MNFILLLLLAALAPVTLAAQSPARTPEQLRAVVASADSAMFAAYNRHDAAGLMRWFSDDLEFYHDLGGLQRYPEVSAAFNSVLSRNDGMRRELVPGSLQVEPVRGFGAMAMGRHKFCHTENGADVCGTFSFLMIWREQNERWQVTRVASWGH
jgi:ketosteroid isomerase-like protein